MAQKGPYPNLNMSGHPAMATFKGQMPPSAAAGPALEAPPSPQRSGQPLEEFKVETDAEDGVDPFVAVVKVIPAPKSHAGARSVVYMEVVTSEVAWATPSVERCADNFKQVTVKATVKFPRVQDFLQLADMSEPSADDKRARALFEYKGEAKRLREACDEFKVNMDDFVVRVDDWRKDVDHDMVYRYTFSHELEPSALWKTGETPRGLWFLIPFIGTQQFADDRIKGTKKLKLVPAEDQ